MFIEDHDTKAKLLVHIIFGASNFSKIKTKIPARTRKTGEQVAELTKFRWMIMSLGQEDHADMYLTQSKTHDYEQLYWLYVPGLEDTSNGDQHTVYTEFKKQHQWNIQGLY